MSLLSVAVRNDFLKSTEFKESITGDGFRIETQSCTYA